MPALVHAALALAVLADAGGTTSAQETAREPPPGAAVRLPFSPEETMEFRVEYLGLKAGLARISVGEPVGDTLPVFLEAKTAGLGAIVSFRQELATHLDLETGFPRASSMLSVEPNYRREVTTRFDRAAGKATVRTKGRSERTREVDVPSDALDFVALVFRLRTLPLEPGSRHEFTVLSEAKIARVVASVERRESIKTKSGKIDALKIRVPTGFTGKFAEKNPTFLWLSDDAKRVVLRISTEFSIGRAVAHLVGYRNGRVAAR